MKSLTTILALAFILASCSKDDSDDCRCIEIFVENETYDIRVCEDSDFDEDRINLLSPEQAEIMQQKSNCP